MFNPVLFSIATTPADADGVDLSKVIDALTAVTTASGSGYTFPFEAIAFVNKHPDLPELLLEVQAHSEEERTQGIDLVNAAVKVALGAELTWNDVTEAALAYHAGLKNAEPEAPEVKE